MHNRTRSLSLAIVALSAGTLGWGAVASAGGSTPPGSSIPDGAGSTVTVVDAGDPATQIELNTLPAVGDMATIETHAVTEGGVILPDDDYDMSANVTSTETIEVTETTDSDFVATGSVVEYESSSALTEGTADLEDPMQALVDVPLEYTFANPYWVEDVELGDDAPSGGDFADLVDSLHQMHGFGAVALPDEPVGVGATWTATVPWTYGDETVPVAADFTLVSVADGAYEISFRSELDSQDFVDTMTEGEDMSEIESADGSFTATGTVHGDVAEPLRHAAAFELRMVYEADYTDDDRDGGIDLTITAERESTPTT